VLFEEWCIIVSTIGAFHDEFLNLYIDSLVKCADFYISSCKTNKAVVHIFWLTQFNGSVPAKGLLYMVTCYKSPWIIHSFKFLILKAFHWWMFCWINSEVVTESFWILSRLKWNTWYTISVLKSNSLQHSLRAFSIGKKPVVTNCLLLNGNCLLK
jgi:hypothetical protein